MPCYTVVTSSIEFKVGNIDLLKKAIEAIGGILGNYQDKDGINFRTKNGKSVYIAFNKSEIIAQNMDKKEIASYANEIKRAYSETVLNELSKKNKWIKKNLGQNRFQLQRF
jgi:propanediol dehydratase large subunit